MDENRANLFRAFLADYQWDEVERRPYKEDAVTPFKTVSRQTLFHDPDLLCELRYFEVGLDGYSTLERHEHAHGVMILRGEARVLVGSRVETARTHDLVRIPPMTWHQFRTMGEEPMGFLCMVNRERDRPQLPGAEELRAMRAHPAVAEFLAGR